VELVLVSLRAFNGKQHYMRKVWFLVKIMAWLVLSLQNPSFELPPNLVNVIKIQFYQRWKMLMINLHYARALFNPYLLDEIHLQYDVDAKEVLNIVLQKKWYPNRLCPSYRKLLKFCWKLRFFFTPLNKGPQLTPT
jgi:hypothetical protein